MVEQADDAPLLFWAEGPAVSLPEPGEPGSWGGCRSSSSSSTWRSGGKGEPGLAGLGRRLQEQEPGQVEEDQIVAVFVVTFDSRTGKLGSVPPSWGWEVGSPFVGRGRTRDPISPILRPELQLKDGLSLQQQTLAAFS